MKVIYFDCFAGIAGDMTLGALVDAGLNLDDLKKELAKLNLTGYEITSERVFKNGIGGTQVNVKIEEQKAHRHLKDIYEIIDGSGLGDDIKTKSKKIFERLAVAEAKIHGTTIEKIHFHEVGAVDAIIDIVGSVTGLHLLGIERVYASKIHLGRGFVNCQHGKIPVPAPATVELLTGVPVYSTGIERELTTPTGAAIVTTLAESFGDMPEMDIEMTGYGGGTGLLEIPNFLRVIIGETADGDYDTDTVTVIETNIDDMNPELYDYVTGKLIRHGALDVYTMPVYMKKNRPGVLLSVFCAPEKVDELTAIMFAETTTIGVRMHGVSRRKLKREIVAVETEYGAVRVKISRVGGKKVNAAPEYEDCKKIAIDKDIPLKQIYDAAAKAAEDI